MVKGIDPSHTTSPAEPSQVAESPRIRLQRNSPSSGTAPIRRLLLRGTISSFGVAVGAAVLGFAESISVARILGESNFGLYALLVSLLNVSIAVASLGIPPAVMKYVSGEAAYSKSASERTLAIAFRATILSSVVTGLGFGVCGSFLLFGLASPSQQLVLAAAIAVATLGTPFLLFSSALQGQGRVTDLNVRSLAGAIFGFGAAVILAVAFSVTGALVAFALGVFLPGILAVRKVARVIRAFPNHVNAKTVTLQSLLNYGVPTLSAQLVVLPVFSLVNWMIAFYWGLPELGLYAAAFTIAGVLTFVPSAVSVPLIPILSSLSLANPRRGETLVPRVMRVMSFVSVPLAILMITLSGPIFALSYGLGFSKAAPYLSILSIAFVLLAVSGVLGRQLAGTGLVKWSLLINIAWAAAVGTATIVLVPSVGSLGASLAILVGYMVTTFLSWIVGKRVLGIDFSVMRLPATWAACFLLLSMALSALSGITQVVVGLALTAAAVASSFLLLEEREKSLVRDAFVLLGFSRQPLRDATSTSGPPGSDHRRR
jgi:stage V sporulation protein B